LPGGCEPAGDQQDVLAGLTFGADAGRDLRRRLNASPVAGGPAGVRASADCKPPRCFS
jgi:hypothetical protein